MSGTRTQIDALNAELAELTHDYAILPDELCKRPLMGCTPEDTLRNIAAVLVVLQDAPTRGGMDDDGSPLRDRGHQLLLSLLEDIATDHAEHMARVHQRLDEVLSKRSNLIARRGQCLRELADDPAVDEILTAQVRELSEQLDGGRRDE